TGYFYVVTPNGSATSPSAFSVQGGAPSITSFAPTGGPVGITVDVRGDNFTGATSVTFGTVATTFTVDSDTEIHATVPNGAMNSYISVVTPRGTAWSGLLFIVTYRPPMIAMFTPTSGPARTSVDILGGNLSDPTSVTIGGRPASYTLDSDSE